MKMKRRQNLRDQKKEGKNLKRLRKLLSDQLMNQQGQIQQEIELEQEEEEEEAEEFKEKKGKGKATKTRKVVKGGKIVVVEGDPENEEGDDEGELEGEWVPEKTLKKLR